MNNLIMSFVFISALSHNVSVFIQLRYRFIIYPFGLVDRLI